MRILCYYSSFEEIKMSDFVNKHLKTLTIIGGALGFAAMATPASAIIAVNAWTEVDDASSSTGNPQSTVGNGPLRLIFGDIGGEDSGDIFAIRFVGGSSECDDICAQATSGDFDASVRFDDGELAETQPLFLELFDENGDSVGVGQTNLFIEGLQSGIYRLGVFTRLEFDPPYTVTFNNNNLLFLTAPSVPEPVTLSLLGAGIAGIGAMRRLNRK
jgi:hypothetical protein